MGMDQIRQDTSTVEARAQVAVLGLYGDSRGAEVSNLSTALALILCVETPNMNTEIVGDLHLPPARRAFGRMQIRKPILDDFNSWDNGLLTWTRADSMNPKLDVLMAQRWLVVKCGTEASVRRYLQTWNGGPTGWKSDDAQAYYRRAIARRNFRVDHFEKCKQEVRRVTK